ncbi:ATP-binding cassette domain-containing protein [Eggerthellaceae bacterium zg-1084]|uniref:methionine ABC transporter ATP-binding protein n=1 Tax=Berryella wangjianweii TaxID=2734634 RepID=UPI0015520D62|nr:ATP-binding cassette domain-containing protein [Berryella wangjianweii]NPD31134.1 ATP-binding cassette domain-containing protein [Berryella wangjianweii]
MIRIEHLSKTYGQGPDAHTALSDVNLHVEAGDIFGILGSSGAGKSTLVRCMNLLERPTSGKVIVDGVDVTDFTGGDLTRLRTSVGMIFQNFSLFQQRTVLRNVTFPLELSRTPREQAEERALELLGLVGIEELAHRYPSQLSGGQQQRVAIARALANEAKIMLCDEATSALDTKTTVAILDLLKQINRELGVTLVVITHALTVAEAICNRIAVIEGGRIVEQGPRAELFANPQSAALQELISNNHQVHGGSRAGA